MAGAVLGTLDFMPPEQRRDATQTDSRSDLWALAFGEDLVSPQRHSVPGMRSVSLPAQDNFEWPSGRATRLLYQHPMREVPVRSRHGELIRQDYSQQIIAHCFATILETGHCEALGFGFETH